MTKNLQILFFLLVISGNLFSQNREFTVTGQLSDSKLDGCPVYLQMLSSSDFTRATTLDSTTVVNRKFVFSGNASLVPEMRIVYIKARNKSDESYTFYVSEPGSIEIKINENTTITGGTENQKHETFKQKMKDVVQQVTTLNSEAEKLEASGRLTEDMVSTLQSNIESLKEEFMQSIFGYTRDNMQNGIGEFYFISNLTNFSESQREGLLGLARTQFQKSKGIESVMQVLVAQNTSTRPYSGPLKDIELQTPNGKKAKLSDFIAGKVVLLDFWASWCGPCRKEMPELVALYADLKAQGFEIVGVSLDEDDRAWNSGIKSMNMQWPQLSDLGGWTSKAARLYNVSSIPQSFLIDKKGNIVAHNLKGKSLINEIERLLKE